jgi:ribosome-associated toxin RatA of RatAB toxin-antitoxin module
VWARVCDVEAYPQFMESVVETRVVERDGGESTVEWTVLLKGSVLRWTERERRIDERHRIEYWQLDGDLARFEGSWQLWDTGGGMTEAVLEVTFEIGIPMLADMLNPVAARAIEQNSRTMLLSLAPMAVGGTDA